MSESILRTIGHPLKGSPESDAIHVAIYPCTAGEDLSPGAHVGLSGGRASVGANPKIGIVDPFLNHDIDAGERFWVFIYPGAITSLRHMWAHPLIDELAPNKDEALKRIEKIASDKGVDTDRLLSVADDYVSTGYGVLNGDPSVFFDEYELQDFWDSFEVLRGRKVSDRAEYFSCSC